MASPTPPHPAFPRRAFLGALACLAGCESKAGPKADSGAQLGKVKLSLNWVPEPEFGGFYAAREGGAFRRAGLDVEIAGGGAGVPVLQMVAAGQSDFGVVGADEVITANARGAAVVPVFATFQTSPQAIMAHASRGAQGISDLLTSGTIAVEPGAPYTLFLKRKYGFDKARVVPYDGGIARFLVEKDFAQQCFATSEPLTAAQKGGDPKVFLIADEGYNPYATLVITRRALWDQKPELVRAFVRAAREGWRAYLDDPTQANTIMAKLNPTIEASMWRASSDAQKRFIETAETGRDHLGKMTAARWEALGRQLVDLGLVKDAPPPSSYLVAVGE